MCYHPQPPVGQRRGVGEPRRFFVRPHDERQVDDPAVERDGPVLIPGVAEVPELSDYGGCIVSQRPADVNEPEPEAGLLPSQSGMLSRWSG